MFALCHQLHLRFAEDLEDVFAHVPFLADPDLFTAATLGAEIRAVESFARPPSAAHLTKALTRVETEATGPFKASDWADGEIFLCADKSGRISGIPAEVWRFA